MNFTKDLVMCEIIEQHESKSIIVVVKFFFRIIIQNDTVLTVMVCACMNECEIPIIYVACSDSL